MVNERNIHESEDEIDVDEINPKLDADTLAMEKDCEHGTNCNNLPPLHKLQIKVIHLKGFFANRSMFKYLIEFSRNMPTIRGYTKIWSNSNGIPFFVDCLWKRCIR